MALSTPAKKTRIPSLVQIARDVRDAEIAKRCISAGVSATCWWRDQKVYTAHRFAKSISKVCDKWVDAFVNGTSLLQSYHAPPGHGKSEHVGKGMGINAMARAPGKAILYVTATAERAEEVSMAVRSACERLSACGAFPHLAPHPDGPWTTTVFRTVGNNWWTGIGSGGSTGGINAHGIIIDDITGSAKRQASAAERETMQRFLLEDVLTRLRHSGPIANMETRRGLNDITAFLQKTWGDGIDTHVWRCKAKEGEQDGRQEGEWLWPERFHAGFFAAMPHLVPGSPIWESLYQQNPITEGGSVIYEDWCNNHYEGTPEEASRTCSHLLIGVDPAAKTGERNDPSAFVVAGVRGTDLLILYSEAIKRSSPDSEQRLQDLVEHWRAVSGKPVSLVIEDTSVGQGWIPNLKKRGLTVNAVQVAGRGDKVERMNPHLAKWAGGQILLPIFAAWRFAFVSEMTTVPEGEHDDQWDAISAVLWYIESTRSKMQKIQPFRLKGAF